MLFNSFNFIIIFIILFFLYWLIPSSLKKIRKIYLIITSYLLYINFNAAYSLVLFGITLITYIGGRVFDPDRDNKRSLFIIFSCITLLPLLIFKYYNFIIQLFGDILNTIGLQHGIPGLNWAIPVGISFFTFQSLGYMIDVYNRRIDAEKNFIDYMLFVSFFPQIVSGPISKASELLPQFREEKKFDYLKAVNGLRVLLWGMFLKVVIADRAGIYVDMIFCNYERFSGITCLIGSFIYSLQIYADFAGYSLMAVGIGKLLGFDLIKNFNRPYFAASITDFWKRWHISLTRWLTQYVYIGMGGNRCSKLRNYYNIIVTFLISGIWHGANWTFIIWGLIHGILQCLERILGINKINSEKWVGIKSIRIVITFMIVNFAWIFFRSKTITDALGYICQIFQEGSFNREGIETILYIMIGGIILFNKEFIQEFFPSLYEKIMNNTIIKWCTYVIVLSLILLLGVFDGGQFIYSNF